MHQFRLWLSRHRILSFTLGLFLTLWAIHELLNWRMDRKWAAYCHEARARGVKLTIAEIIPPEVPDDENFAATPLIRRRRALSEQKITTFRLTQGRYDRRSAFGDRSSRGSIDWKMWQDHFVRTGTLAAASPDALADVLRAFETFAPQRAEWRAAAQRKHSRFPYYYKTGATIPTPDHLALYDALQFFGLELRAHLAHGDSARAYESFQDALQSFRAIEHEPFLVSALNRTLFLDSVCAGVGDGLADQRWADQELQKVSDKLRSIDLLAASVATYSNLRPFENETYNKLASASPLERRRLLRSLGLKGNLGILLPRRFYRREQLRQNQYFDESIARIDVPAGKVHFDRSTPSSAWQSSNIVDWYLLESVLTFSGTYDWPESVYLQQQASLSQTVIACALERFRLAHGCFPESLAELQPSFLTRVPDDIFAAAPMIYRRVGDDSFLLYSIGWDRIDNGGAPKPMGQLKQIDILWPYAPKKLAVP